MGTALFNAIYAQNWLEVVNLVAGVNDPDRGNNQSGLYGRRELGAMLEEFIYMRGWIASVPETLLTQRRTVERTLVQTEAHLYGSSRLGVDKVNRLLLKQSVTEVYVPFSKRWVFLRVEGAPTVQPDDDSLYLCIRGKKRYEFSNHLGNVMTTLTDRRVWESNSSRWTADAISGQDYDPFGMVRPNRSASDDGYRFGFNGKEKDTEFSNESYDFGARIYDGRVARWLSVDPVFHEDESPYIAFSNNPIFLIDDEGESPISFFVKQVVKAGLKKAAKEFVEVQIKKRLAKYATKNWAKQLGDDAMAFVDVATSSEWYEVVIEFIPVGGEIYGAQKLGQQGYALWKGLKKFEKIAELGEKGAKAAWKKLGTQFDLKGKGAVELNRLIDKMNNTVGRKLNENTIGGAIKEKFGLKSGFKDDGTPWNHLESLKTHFTGLNNQINDLQNKIKVGTFEGDALKAAEGVLDAAKKQRDEIQHLINSADKAVGSMGKIYE